MTPLPGKDNTDLESLLQLWSFEAQYDCKRCSACHGSTNCHFNLSHFPPTLYIFLRRDNRFIQPMIRVPDEIDLGRYGLDGISLGPESTYKLVGFIVSHTFSYSFFNFFYLKRCINFQKR
jgi:hypothetical protein